MKTKVALAAISFLVLFPFLGLGLSIFDPLDTSISLSFLSKVFSRTLILALGVGIVTALLGTSLAYLSVYIPFWGRLWISRLLILPLAFPPYVLAFIHVGLWDLADWIRSVPGAILILSLALYPYVYIVARQAFIAQGNRVLEMALSLGHSKRRSFFQALFPSIRPWVIGASIVVMMEVIADFGAVSVLNIETFTYAIYRSWFGYFSFPLAVRLSCLLLLLAIGLLGIESIVQSKKRRFQNDSSHPIRPLEVPSYIRGLALVFCLSTILISVGIPLTTLAHWSWQSLPNLNTSFFEAALNTLIVSIIASFVIVGISFSIAIIRHIDPSPITKILARLVTVGYALPGTLLAVGLYAAFSLLPYAHLLTGSIILMIIGFALRFMRVGVQPIQSAVDQLNPQIDEAAQNLGASKKRIIKTIYFPLLKLSIGSSFLFVFCEIMKEMPISLMSRPFGWDTLSIKIYELSSEGHWLEAAIPSILLVLIGMIPLLLIMKSRLWQDLEC